MVAYHRGPLEAISSLVLRVCVESCGDFSGSLISLRMSSDDWRGFFLWAIVIVGPGNGRKVRRGLMRTGQRPSLGRKIESMIDEIGQPFQVRRGLIVFLHGSWINDSPASLSYSAASRSIMVTLRVR